MTIPVPPCALALAAGGARGAFQAGALLFLAEFGVRFDAIAGSSVGALNGAFLAQGDGSPDHVQALCSMWRSLPSEGLVRLGASPTALLDPRPLARVLDRVLDYDGVARSPTNLIVVVLEAIHPLLDLASAAFRAATYLEARTLGAADLRSALLAAAAIPLAYPSRTLGGRSYADGGLSDPLPARFLYQSGARRIVSVFLSDDTPQNRADFPGATLLQVRPSIAIDQSLAATFDFSRPMIEQLIDRGYADARATLREATQLAQQLLALRERGLANVRLADRLPPRGREPR